MSYAIGIDIGGTKIAIAIVSHNGDILAEDKLLTDLLIEPEKMIEQAIKATDQLLANNNLILNDLIGIGIGAPGPLNSKTGMITNPPNLSNWINIPIVKHVQAHYPIPVRLENDANAAALAEKWIGAAQANQDFVYLTISTGIGAGIYANGQLITGARGNAGDFGHTVIDPSYGQCNCGQFGCLEHIASGTAIAKKGSEIAGEVLSTAEVFSRYQQDPNLTLYLDDVFRILGTACVTLINTFDPEKIVIGGGVANVGDVLFNGMKHYVSRYALNPDGRNTEIVSAKLEQHAGVIGAAALCFEQ